MKTIVKLAILSIGLLTYTACMDDEIISNPEVIEGEPATISLSLQKSEPTEIETRVTDPDSDLKYLHVLVFDANAGNALKTKAYFHGTDKFISASATLNTISGNSIIYVVVNLSSAYAVNGAGPTYFDDVTSLSDFRMKMAKTSKIIGFDESLLVMTGKSGIVNIAPGTNATTTILLKRLSSKILVNVVKAMPLTDRLDLYSWQVLNAPGYSYVDSISIDAVAQRPEAPADSNYFKSPTQKFTDVMLPNNKPALQGLFYVFENRKGKNNSITSQKQRASAAPARATAVLIKGRYSDPTGVRDIAYLVHLGKDSLTDYNVERNCKYTYTLTVKSANEYSTQVEVSKQDSRVTVNPLFAFDINEPVLDCHYDWRPIRLRSSVGFARVEVVDATTELSTNDPNKQWLKLSLSASWPTSAQITSNPSLQPALSQTVSLTSSGSMLYLYADEMFNGIQPISSARKLKLKVTYTPSTNAVNLNNADSCYVFTREITQKPILLFGNMGLKQVDILGNYDGNVAVFGMENQEEAIMKLGFSGLSATGLTTMLPWGFNGVQKQIGVPNYFKRNGMQNSFDLVWQTSSILYDPSTLVSGTFDPIYNTYAARYCFDKNRDENLDGVISGSEIKWYLPSRGEQVIAWIGKRALTATGSDIPSESCWSSTENNPFNALNMNFSNGGTGGIFSKTNGLQHIRCVRRIDNSLTSNPKSPYVPGGTREITGLPAGVSAGHPVHVKGVPFRLHGAEEQWNTVAPRFEVAQLDCNVDGTPVPILLTGTVSMEWYKACGWSNEDGGTVATPATGCNAYCEGSVNDPNTGAGMWRMPTQRELMTIWAMQSDLANGFVQLAAKNYWSSPNYYKEAWYTNFQDGLTAATYRIPGDPLVKLYVRCVRDVTD